MSQSARAINGPWRGLFKIALLVLVIIAANLLTGWIAGLLKFELLPSNEEFVHRMITIVAIAYVVALAIPFVPGIEIGLALIGMLGAQITFLVYVCTVAGLSLSFAVGRVLSLKGLIILLGGQWSFRVVAFCISLPGLSQAPQCRAPRGPRQLRST